MKENVGTIKTQVIILLLSILSVFVVYNSLKPAVKGVCRVILQSGADPVLDIENRIVGVEAAVVKTGTTLRQVKTIGTLKGNSEVLIKSEIPGKIKEILFTEGAQVESGQDLIAFEDDGFKANKEKYEAEYAGYKSDLERMKKLYEGKVGSQKAYEEALAKMNVAKAQLDDATYQLSKTRIKAPFSGTIGIMRVSPGNIVQQHTDLVTIVDNSLVKAEFSVPAKYIENIAVGQNVEVVVGSFKDKVFSGAVDAIDSEVDKNSSILVRAAIPNKNGLLRHGMFVNVKLITGEKGDVVLVDEDALDREGSIEYVWFIDAKGRAYRKRVLTGAKNENGVEILTGLKAGDIVVLAGQMKLSEGARTKILNKLESVQPEKTKNGENENSEEVAEEPDAASDSINESAQHHDKAERDDPEVGVGKALNNDAVENSGE